MNVKKMFARISSGYDIANRIISGGFDRWWRKNTVSLMKLDKGCRVIDLCTGTGDLAGEVMKCIDGGEVIGIDFCPETLEIARRKFPKDRFPRLIFRESDVMTLPFPDESFDLACGAFMLRNLPDLEKFLAETYRIIKPGGQVVFLELFPPKGFLPKIYLKYGVPLIGGIITGSKPDYQYLGRSVLSFISTEKLMNILKVIGFIKTRKKSLFYQVPNIILAEKPGGGEIERSDS
ncbi:MAG: ubiquinone/menaquinone biosynthesis methyltransferase [Candidatus Eremiobacteraeota bacterium]|nr:ubiquinone/menaquinone biosynthesis methyltransferase [Candidatus Eremiobacteraeota bacterium]